MRVGSETGSVMDRRVVLHIGTMKTGTSFIQSVLGSNKADLAEAGVVFPGGFGVQARAVRDMLKLPRQPRRNRRRWGQLAEQVHAGDATAIFSMEFLSFAGEEQVPRLVEPFAGLDVRVVLTVRDQFRVLPAQWQTYTRNFGTDGWEDYLRHVQPSRMGSGRNTRAFKTFHRAQDIETILSRWSSVPGVSSVEVVTVPPSGAPREELWHRFCAAAGIPAPDVSLDEVRDNESLGYASCDYLRRANVHLQDVAPRRYRKGMRPLASRVLVPLRAEETRPQLDQKAATYARTRNAEIRDLLTRGGHRLHGSLEDLPVPRDLTGYSTPITTPPHEQVLRAARAVWDDAASTVGVAEGSRPEGLDDLVADGTRLLRQANAWDG